ncbi:MAG: Fe-S protein assembly co-chaperone HscB [Alphaproteobacteria bacterium]|nr:Fe-S protein assembly co-chaperone HscB [Alphaproteobacteria bacterium]
MTTCWHCWAGGIAAGQLQCAGCNALQPPQAVDYFTLLGQPASFDPPLSALEAAYLTRQQAVHPDRLVGRPMGLSARERAYAASHSANLNDAWQTLRQPLSRALYLCRMLGIDLGSSDGRFADTPHLLQKNMDLQEALMEAAGDIAATAALKQQIADMLQQQQDQLKTAFAAHLAGQDQSAIIRAGTLRLQFLTKLS